MVALARAEIMRADDTQLRLWVAEYIDGWEWEYVGSNAKTLLRGHDGVFDVGATIIENDIQFVMLPNYPADIAAAWTALEKISVRYNCAFAVAKEKHMGYMTYYARVSGGELFYDAPDCVMVVVDDKPERAACKVALLASLSEQAAEAAKDG